MSMPQAYFLTRHGAASTAFTLQEMPTRPLRDHEVRIASEGFGLNFADVMARLGQYPECPPLPTVIGYEAVGKVIETGAAVTHVTPGQRVLAFTRFGGYAQEVITSGRGVMPIPDSWDIGFATALATQYATAWYAACYVTNLHPGERVLIHAAAGGVGTALIQLALHHGCEVFGTAGSPEKIEHLKKTGVHHAINYRQQPFESAVKTILGSERLDVIFDPIGGHVSRQGYKLLSSGGRLVCYGAAGLTGKTNLLQKMRFAWQFGLYHPVQLMMRSKSFIGVNMLKVGDYRPEALQYTMQQVVKGAQEGYLKPENATIYRADQLATAHEALQTRKTIGKVAIQW